MEFSLGIFMHIWHLELFQTIKRLVKIKQTEIICGESNTLYVPTSKVNSRRVEHRTCARRLIF